MRLALLVLCCIPFAGCAWCEVQTPVAVSGEWTVARGIARLPEPSDGWAVAALPDLRGDIVVEADLVWNPNGPNVRTGVVFGYQDARNFATCVLSLSDYKAWNSIEPEKLYTITVFQTVGGVERVTNYCPWVDPKVGKHHLKLTVVDRQVLANLDGRDVLQGGVFPELAGGGAGVAAWCSRADFSNIKVAQAPVDRKLYGVGNVSHRPSGEVAPRWPWKEMVIRPTRFVMWAGESAGANLVKDEYGKTWPGYVYACTINLNGTIGNPTNYPPQEFSFHNNGFLDYYMFTGDKRALKHAKVLADWLMDPAHMIPSQWPLHGLSVTRTGMGKVCGDGHSGETVFPWPFTAADAGSGKVYGGVISIEEQGAAAITVLRLYHLTGERKYLDYCKGVADCLLRIQLSEGNWHYRMNPQTAEPHNDWTANVIDNILFLDEMAATTGNKAYASSARRAEKWMIEVPCKSDRWLGIFGDVPSNIDIGWAQPANKGKDNLSGFVAMGAGRHLLSTRGGNAQYVKMAEHLRKWIVDNFSGTDSNKEQGITEQTVCFYVMPYHGFHQSMLECDLYEATRNEDYRRAAFHYLNAGQYQTELNGFIHLLGGGLVQGGLDTWWCNITWAPTAYVYAMGTFPEMAPSNENHLVRVSSPLTSILYTPDGVTYSTARGGTDRLVVATKPASVKCGGKRLEETEKLGGESGWSYDARTHLLLIRHPAGSVEVRVGR